MINIQKERDGLSWDGLTWVGKMIRDDSGTGWKRDGLSRIPTIYNDPVIDRKLRGNYMANFRSMHGKPDSSAF